MKFNLQKYIWCARAIITKPLYGKFKMPSYIGKPTFLEGRKKIYIGKYVRIFPGIRMEGIGKGTIKIGDNTAIEQNVHITSADKKILIGKDVTIAGNSLITNMDHDYKDINKSVMDQPNISEDTVIGDGCFIGYGSVILAGTKLGKHCVVGANSVVRGVFQDYSVIVGSPAKAVKVYNIEEKKWKKC